MCEIEERVNEIEKIRSDVEGLQNAIEILHARKKEAESYLIECKLRLGEDLNNAKLQDGVLSHSLSDGRTVRPHKLPIKVIIENEQLIPEEYIRIVTVNLEKRLVDREKLERDLLLQKKVPGAHLEGGKFSISVKWGNIPA